MDAVLRQSDAVAVAEKKLAAVLKVLLRMHDTDYDQSTAYWADQIEAAITLAHL